LGPRNRSFFLAIILATAAPVFADSAANKALIASIDGDQSDSSRQGAFHGKVVPAAATSHNFAVDAIKPGGARIDFGSAGSARGFSESAKGSELAGSLSAGLASNSGSVSVFDVASMHGNVAGVHEDKDLGKHHGNEGASALSVIAVSEPGSGTLSLFGFAILGMIVYRRKGPTSAI
jgi:hypothetical protein